MNSSLLVEAALRSVFLALAVWTGLGVLKVRNVLAQKAAWGLVLAGALVMPVVLPMASHWSVLPANVRVVLPADPGTLLEELQARIQAKTLPEEKPAVQPAAPSEGALMVQEQPVPSVDDASGDMDAAPAKAESPDADRFENTPPQTTVRTEPAAPIAVTPARAAYSLSKALLLLYLAVAGILLIRLGGGLIAAMRLWRRAKPVAEALPMANDASVDIRWSAEISSPVTICSGIVLPADYRSWDGEKLRVVLAHERSHIRQKDFYLQLLAGVYAGVVWFSPLGWWLKHKLSDLAEAISDRAGLEEAADRASYAQILLEFAAAPRPTLIGVAMARSGSLSRRIERLLNDVSFCQAFAGSSRALAAVLVVPVVLFAVAALVRVEAAGQQAPTAPAPAVAPQPPSAPALTPVTPVTGEAPAAPMAGEAALAAPETDEDGTPSLPALAPQAAVPAAPSAPAIAPVAPAGGPVMMIAPPAPAARKMMLMVPKTPAPPDGALMIIPQGPVRMKIMQGRKVPEAGLVGGPLAPKMAMILPRGGYGEGSGYGSGQSTTTESGTSSYSKNGKHSGYHYSYSSNGESYAVLRGGDMNHMTFSGNWMEGRHEEMEKAQKLAGGKDILWFTRDGKDYFVDDPATLSQIEAMYKPMEELGRQQDELGKKQEVLGKQQEDLGKQQETASIPTPDMSKEIARIDAAMAKLKASQGKNMTQEEFGDLQEKVGELQARLGEMQGRIGEKQGEFGARMGELGEKMGELGAKMGELGEQQGRIGQEADHKVKSIIDESMKNGKAHLVQ